MHTDQDLEQQPVVRRLQDFNTASGNLGELCRSIGQKRPSDEYLGRAFGLPLHLRFAVDRLAAERAEVPSGALDSIPFYSLCRAVFLPLWCVAAATAVTPLLWVHRRHRRKLREVTNLCVSCGYDVRATPARCPECGTVANGIKLITSPRQH